MRKLLGVVFVLLFVVAACGGGDGESGTGTQTGTGTEPGGEDTAAEAPVELDGEVNNHGSTQLSGTTLEMEADDFYFEPTFVQAETGTTVEVTVTNEGNAPHTFTIEDQDVDVQVDSGESETVEVTIDEGMVNFVCTFHVGQGMQGAFHTGTGATAGGGTGTGDEDGGRSGY